MYGKWKCLYGLSVCINQELHNRLCANEKEDYYFSVFLGAQLITQLDVYLMIITNWSL